MKLTWFFLGVYFLQQALADVALVSPKSGQTFSGSGGSINIDVSWVDDTDDTSDDLSLTKAKQIVLSLCTGGNTGIQCFSTLTTTKMGDTRKFTVKIGSDACSDGFYFIQAYTSFDNDDHTIHYTNRFELTDMKGNGKTLATPISVPVTVTGDPPVAQTEYAHAVSINAASFKLTYTAQTGSWRFAPMQLQPGTDPITRTDITRKFPTSAVSYFSTLGPKPVVFTTTTAEWSYTITSVHNWAAVAPYPTVAYAAKDKVTSASLKGWVRKKRWFD